MTKKRKRVSRSKRFGEVLVQVDRLAGEGIGSRVVHGEHIYRLPHWPARFENVEEKADGLTVTFSDGSKRMLDPRFDAIMETAAGGSMGGHDPKAHGKIRYIVRSFGKWAKGKHSVCVRRIVTEHPEVAAGKDVNALCAWLKDQWAGTTKWRRTPGENKASYKKREKRVIAAARESAVARLCEGLKWLDAEQLDAMVEDVRKLTGIEPEEVFTEIYGGDPPGREPGRDIFECIWEADSEANVAALTSVVLEVRDALREDRTEIFRPLLEEWLGLHGDGGMIREDMASVRGALQRAARLIEPDKLDRGRSEIERRVMECQRGVYAPGEEAVMETAHSTTRTMYADADQPAERIVEAQGEPYVLPPPRAEREYVRNQLREAGVDADDQEFEFPEHLKGLSSDRLREIARELYEATGDATVEGRRRLNREGPMELARIIVDIEEISKPGYKGNAKKCAKCGSAVKGEAKRCQNCESGKFREAAQDAATIDQLIAVGASSFKRFQRSFEDRASDPDSRGGSTARIDAREADTRSPEEITRDAVAAAFAENRTPAQRASQMKATWASALVRHRNRPRAEQPPEEPAEEEAPDGEVAEAKVRKHRRNTGPVRGYVRVGPAKLERENSTNPDDHGFEPGTQADEERDQAAKLQAAMTENARAILLSRRG